MSDDLVTIQIQGQAYTFERNRVPSFVADRDMHFLYVSNPKCGCTSILNALFFSTHGFIYMEPENIHYSYYSFWRMHGYLCSPQIKSMFNRQYKCIFSTVRHPLNRFVSAFIDKLMPGGEQFYFERRDLLCALSGIDLGGDPEKAAIETLEWLERDPYPHEQLSIGIDPHFRQQSKNLALDHSFPVSTICKIEDTQSIVNAFERFSNRSFAGVFSNAYRRSSHPATAALLKSATLRRTVERVYKSDFDAFGYN